MANFVSLELLRKHLSKYDANPHPNVNAPANFGDKREKSYGRMRHHSRYEKGRFDTKRSDNLSMSDKNKPFSTKKECYACHKIGHLASHCKVLRS